MTTTLTHELTTARTHLDAFSECERSLPGADRPGIARLRRAAIARFGEQGFPGERSEDWKFTSVSPLTRTPHQPGRASEQSLEVQARDLPAGVELLTLQQAIARHPELVEGVLGQHADTRTNPFVALNTAGWDHGVFLHVPAGVVVAEPIHLNFQPAHADEGLPAFWHRRVLVLLGARSQATLVEQHRAGSGVRYASTTVAEILLGEGALLDHYKVLEDSTEATHLSTTQVVLEERATFSTHFIGLGGHLVRNEVRAVFTGEHAEATVNGLYLASGSQHVDNHTVIDHARPNCQSHELYKGVLGGKSRGVFNGKIFVRPQAQKTDAKQTNKTLLLSDDATINTKPQLEIYADDVKCTHGATVGQLDEEQLFYLRARGVGAEQARALLTFAFANDILGRVKVPSLRQRLEAVLLASNHLPTLAETEEE